MNTLLDLIGCIFEIEDRKYRILHIESNTVILIQLDTTKLFITYYPLDNLLDEIKSDDFSFVKEEKHIFDLSKMDDSEREEYHYRLSIISKIVDEYGPEFIGLTGKQSKPLINKILEEEKGKLSKATLWCWIRKYLQSGCNYNALIDIRHHPFPKKTYHYKVKTGRPLKSGATEGLPLTDKVLFHFHEALEQLRLGRYMTIEKAYHWMIKVYYSYKPDPNIDEFKPLPLSERPTLNQFYHYVKKYYSKEQKIIDKTSKMEARNNNRLLFGSSRTDAYRPGKICECDALEADVMIIYDDELDEKQCVGRPIVYMMIDVYSSMIVAISASYQNNSYVGLTNLFLNLGEDKVEYAAKYGITIKPEVWRSCFIPDVVRCDRGADFKGDKFGLMCKNMKIRRDLVTPGTGSYKGLIEESFASFQKSFRSNLENKGLITKRHDSNHHKQALLTLEQFTQLLIHFVVSHNQKQIINYPMDKAMHCKKGFKPIPYMLWDYGCEKFGSPKYITSANRDQYYYDVLIEKRATITRSGLHLSGLTYINKEDRYFLARAFEAGNNSKEFIVRCDPRDVSKIYYMHDNMLFSAKLNTNLSHLKSYEGMPWERYRLYNHKRNNDNNQGKKNNRDTNFKREQNYNKVVNDALANNQTYAKTKDINKHRQIASQKTDYENNVSTYVNTQDNEVKFESTFTDEKPYIYDSKTNEVIENKTVNTSAISSTNNTSASQGETENKPLNPDKSLDNVSNEFFDALDEHRFKGSE